MFVPHQVYLFHHTHHECIIKYIVLSFSILLATYYLYSYIHVYTYYVSIFDSIFKTLPTKNTEFREAWKKFNDALLLYSCYHGNVETVNAIMNLNSSAHIRR